MLTLHNLVSEVTQGTRLPMSQWCGARFPRWAVGEALFHRRWWEGGRWGQPPLTRDRRETTKWIPQLPFIRVFRLTIQIMPYWRDLEWLREKAVAKGAYRGGKYHFIIRTSRISCLGTIFSFRTSEFQQLIIQTRMQNMVSGYRMHYVLSWACCWCQKYLTQ
jgi:hypothetical protein